MGNKSLQKLPYKTWIAAAALGDGIMYISPPSWQLRSPPQANAQCKGLRCHEGGWELAPAGTCTDKVHAPAGGSWHGDRALAPHAANYAGAILAATRATSMGPPKIGGVGVGPAVGACLHQLAPTGPVQGSAGQGRGTSARLITPSKFTPLGRHSPKHWGYKT